MSRWEAERRLDFIEDRLIDLGRINRQDICDYFGITISQASKDLGRYCEQNKRVMYDLHLKAYRWRDEAKAPKPARASTTVRRLVWPIFDPSP